jgi:hypothetical protein
MRLEALRIRALLVSLARDVFSEVVRLETFVAYRAMNLKNL